MESDSTTRSFIALIPHVLGMSMLWPLFRYASFFMLLYPTGSCVGIGSLEFTTHLAFLTVLSIIGIFVFMHWPRVEGFLQRKAPVCALMGVTSVGVLISLLCTMNVIPDGAIWLSVTLVAIGFVTIYLAWAALLARMSVCQIAIVLGLSFFISYVLFSHGGILGNLLGGWLAALCMPIFGALMWLWALSGEEGKPVCDGNPAISGFPASTGSGGETGRDAFSLATFATPLFIGVGAFLVVGGAVRGIVDLQGDQGSGRFGVSLVLSALIALSVVMYWRCHARFSPAVAPLQRRLDMGEWSIFAMVVMLVLSIMYLGGLFAFLVLDDKQPGGDVVVISRSAMEFVLLLLLFDRTVSKNAPVTPAFVSCGISVQLFSWLLSYGVIPAVLGGEGADAPSSDTFVLAILFGTVSVLLVALVVWMFLAPGNEAGKDSETVAPTDGSSPVVANASDDAVLRWFEGQARLTRRESEVALHFAQGHSLSKVASSLDITLGTAQSHIKSAYRKLDVHSRDELKDLIDSVRAM